MRRAVSALVVVLAALAAAPAALAAPGDTARYILPPGNYGGLPTTENSTDQLPLYDGLTPLRGNVSAADIERLFLPENFSWIQPVRLEETGRPGLRLIYDAYGIPHVYGDTRADMAFGAGWVTARDRGLLIQVGRGPARVAVADVPNVNAFSLVTSAQSFTPSAEAEALVTRQVELIKETYGAKGEQIIADAQAYADGVNAYWQSTGNPSPPATVNDVIAVTAFIGSIFGAGGGGEAANAELLAKLQARLGAGRGRRAWDDVMLADDPEAPTTIDRRFDYGPLTGGRVRGSVKIDPGSIQQIDPRGASAARARTARAGAAPARKRASNFLVVAPERSATGNTLATMGPQLGYYYPEIVQQIELQAPGIKAQGIAVPGLAMYMLIGRTENYAWSLTSAGHDVRDVYAEELCEPDGSAPTRASTHYRFRNRCVPLTTFNAGELAGQPLRYLTSVHGGVLGTATVGGKPYALARRRSTFGRDGLNLAALKDMTEGKADTPERFFDAANQFGFTFNWAYASRSATATFSSGLLPRRPRGLDRRLVTLGDGRFEWKGYLRQDQHPHAVGGPGGLLLNWNNRSAPGFMHGDDEPYGSAQRVELFDRYPGQVDAAGQRQHHEPRGDRGRALAGVADRQPRPALGQYPQRARRAGDRDPRRLGGPRRPASGRRQRLVLRRAWPGHHGRRVPAAHRGGHEAGVLRRPPRGPQRRPRAERPVRALVRRQGPAHAARRPGAREVQPALLRQRLARGMPRVAVGGAQPGGGHHRLQAGHERSDRLALHGRPHELPARPAPEHVPHDQPPDVPAGHRVPAPVAAGAGAAPARASRAGG